MSLSEVVVSEMSPMKREAHWVAPEGRHPLVGSRQEATEAGWRVMGTWNGKDAGRDGSTWWADWGAHEKRRAGVGRAYY